MEWGSGWGWGLSATTEVNYLKERYFTADRTVFFSITFVIHVVVDVFNLVDAQSKLKKTKQILQIHNNMKFSK